MIVFSEYMRRWHDMDMVSRQNSSADMLKYHTLVVNRENPIIQKIITLDEQGKHEEVKTLCSYIHDLSMLEQKPFSGKELKSFIARQIKCWGTCKVSGIKCRVTGNRGQVTVMADT
jgi:molecular chaperone HtpG